MKSKVIGWNINQRSGMGKGIPQFALLGTAFPLNSPVFLIRLSTVLYFALSNFIISLPPFSLIRDFIIQYLFLLKRVGTV